MVIDQINQLLEAKGRRMIYNPELIKCGSVGERLFASFSDRCGLMGSFHFIHLTNISDLWVAEFQDISFSPRLQVEDTWYPTHVNLRHKFALFEVTENKFITQDDVVVNEMTFSADNGPCVFQLSFSSSLFDGKGFYSDQAHGLKFEAETRCTDPELLGGSKEITLGQGESYKVTIAVKFRLAGERSVWTITDLGQHLRKQNEFYSSVPSIECSDPAIEKVYWYRWFLVKHHMARPGAGNLPHACFYESRNEIAMIGTNEWDAEGWEFSRAILASSPLHILEALWMKDPQIVKEELRTYTDRIGEAPKSHPDYPDNLFPGCIRVHDFQGHYFFHSLPYSLWIYYCKTGDEAFVQEIVETLYAELLEWPLFEVNSPHQAELPLLIVDGDTAMELAPAAYFDFSEEKRWQRDFIPHRRTEANAFYALNMHSLGQLFRAIGDGRREACFASAERIKQKCLEASWDEEEAFFLETDALMRKMKGLKQIGGFFVLFCMDPPDSGRYFAHLGPEGAFHAPAGIPSVSMDSFGYYPNNTIDGRRPHMCLWNGPLWPYSTSYALTAIGTYMKRNPHSDAAALFREQFMQYTAIHFRNGNSADCCIGEHYHPVTGECLSAEDHYNHSSYLDILLRMVTGFDFDDNGSLNFSPLGLKGIRLRINGIIYHQDFYDCEVDGISGIARLWRNGEVVMKKTLEL